MISEAVIERNVYSVSIKVEQKNVKELVKNNKKIVNADVILVLNSDINVLVNDVFKNIEKNEEIT